MDRHFVATLALRLLGLYSLLQALLPLGYVAGGIVQALGNEEPVLEWVLGSVVALVLLLGFGLSLLRWAPALAARWVGPPHKAADAGGLTSLSLELLGYRLLGAYAVLTNAPSFLGQVGSYAGLARASGWDFMTRDVLTSSLGTLIGAWLLLGARGLAGLVQRMRGAGLQESEQPWKSV